MNRAIEYKEFVEQHGCHPKGSHPLARWRIYIRTRYRKGLVEKDLEEYIRTIPQWCWGKEDTFKIHVETLVDYLKEHGKFPPAKSKLGTWIKSRRREYYSGALTKEHRKALEAVPGWTWGPPPKARDWDPRTPLEKARALAQYVEEHGEFPPGDHPLSKWARSRRGLYQMGNRYPEIDGVLEAIPGWWWYIAERNVLKAKRFKEYVETTGKLPRRQDKLGMWMNAQRYKEYNGTLEEEIREILESVDLWVQTRGKNRQMVQMAQEVVAHIRETGRIPRTSHPKYGSWVNNRRFEHRHGRLNPEVFEILNAEPRWKWDVAETRS